MRLIDADALKRAIENYLANRQDILIWESDMFNMLDNAPFLDFEKTMQSEYQNGYWSGYNDAMAKTWTNHQVACILAELFNDTCACNYCGIDEWLPQKCDFASKECPDVVGVACWEQFLKHKMKGAENETD